MKYDLKDIKEFEIVVSSNEEKVPRFAMDDTKALRSLLNRLVFVDESISKLVLLRRSENSRLVNLVVGVDLYKHNGEVVQLEMRPVSDFNDFVERINDIVIRRERIRNVNKYTPKTITNRPGKESLDPE